MFPQEKTRDRIEEDLQVSEAMASSMSSYLDSATVYYPLATPTYPKLTLGNFLMRQQRLWALPEALSDAHQKRLEAVVFQFQQAVDARIVRVEQKGHEEAGIRWRQWQQTVTELKDTPETAIPYYATAVENRVMLAALLDYLQRSPYQLDEQLRADTAVVDHELENIWREGAFIWPDIWQSVYPQHTYWWLYGQPTRASSGTHS